MAVVDTPPVMSPAPGSGGSGWEIPINNPREQPPQRGPYSPYGPYASGYQFPPDMMPPPSLQNNETYYGPGGGGDPNRTGGNSAPGGLSRLRLPGGGGGGMAYGDHSRVQNAIEYQGGLAQNHLNNFRTNVTRQNQGLENRFNVAADRGERDYSDLMGAGAGLMGQMVGGPMHGFGAYGGYQDFANNGGFDDQSRLDYRNRAFAPIRSAYAGANREVERAKGLQGGYAPNYIAAKAKMARDQAIGLGDASTNVEAGLHDAINQNRLAGLGGMNNADAAMLNAETQRLGQAGNIYGQMGQLYGTAPGAANAYGNMMNTSTGHAGNIEQLQTQIMDSIIKGNLGMAGVQGNFGAAMGNIGGALNNIYGVAGLFGGYVMPFNEAFDIIEKLRQASMFGAPPLERQFATPEDTAYIRQNVTDDARRASPPDAAPESSDDDILAKIQAMFPQQHEAQDRLRELMNQQPSRNQYKPSFWRRLAAGAVAGGDPNAADRWANKKYYGAEEEWKSRLNPIKELADSEQSTNMNSRSISNQLILNESRQRETDRKTAADNLRAQGEREKLAQKDRYIEYKRYKDAHPNHLFKTDGEGHVYAVDPQTNKVNYLTDSEGDFIEADKLPEREKLELQHENKTAEIHTTGDERIRGINAQGAVTGTNIEKRGEEQRKTDAAKPAGARGGARQDLPSVARFNHASDVFNAHPELQPYIQLDYGKHGVAVIIPKGGSKQLAAKANALISGTGAAVDMSKGGVPIREDGKVHVRLKADTPGKGKKGDTGWVSNPDSSIYEVIK